MANQVVMIAGALKLVARAVKEGSGWVVILGKYEARADTPEKALDLLSVWASNAR